jgi:glycine/D-amino acid oxidase-like deaminating enzyme
VSSIRRVEDQWVLTTQRGRIRAAVVVACTNAYTTADIPELERSFYPCIGCVVNTTAISPDVRDKLLVSGATISQLGFPAALQKDLAGRVYLATLPKLYGAADSGDIFSRLTAWLAKAFPQIPTLRLEMESYWTGRTANTLDRLPRIYSPAPNFFAPMCWNGLGITTCTQFGVVLADAISSNRYDSLPLPVLPPSSLRFRSAYDLAMRVMVNGLRLGAQSPSH